MRHFAGRLRKAGLKLKPTKCNFCQQHVAFLGHIVSASGTVIDPAKTEVISKWPTPWTIGVTCSSSWGWRIITGRFWHHGQATASPNRKKSTAFTWTDACQHEFDELRNS